jgi:transcription elongation factor Elf1
MAVTMFDQWPFSLACGHTVVLDRLDKADTWTCKECGKTTDLRVEPYRTELENDRDTANQIDKQARQRGETVVRADPNDPPRS